MYVNIIISTPAVNIVNERDVIAVYSSSELHDMFYCMFEQMDLYVFGLSFANAAALLCKHYC